jgi:hypothetical protein
MAIERCLTAFGFLLTILSSKLITIVFCTVVAQIIMVVLLKPYRMFGERIRPLLNLSISALILIIYLLTQPLSSPGFQEICPFIILALLALSLSYNVYYLLKDFCKKAEPH